MIHDRLAKFRRRMKGKEGAGNAPAGAPGAVCGMPFTPFAWAVCFFVVIMMVVWYFVLGPSRHLSGSSFNHQQNAVWAQHAWSDTPHTPEEIRQFVETLATHDVRYVYLHVGPLEPDGTIPPERYKELRNFLRVSHEYSDKIQFLAWMGQLRSKLPLERLEVRQHVVKTAEIFVKDYGMAGVHYDIEPIVDGDSDFLFLLEDTRKALGAGNGDGSSLAGAAIISVALPEMIPDYVFRVARRFMELRSFLASEMYRQIADRANQIVVMTYENSIKSGWIYQYFLKNEIIWITQLLADKSTKILIGLPTYDKPTESFHPEAENIRSGLLGVIDGLNSWRSHVDSFAGVALYGSWTTDDSEWKTLETLFLKKP